MDANERGRDKTLQYNEFVVKRDWALVASILLILGAAIIAPRLYLGWRNIELGREADSEGRYGDAAQSYEQAARLLPWRVDLWEPAGVAAFRAGDSQDAARWLELADQRAPLSVDGSVVLGSALWTDGKSAEAIAAWQAGLQNHPNEPALLDRLIAAYDHQGDYDNEQVALTRRISLGDDAASNYRLGLLLMSTDPGQARIQLQKAAALDPQYAAVVATLQATLRAAASVSIPSEGLVITGRGLGLVGEWGLASNAFEKAIRADENDAEAWAWLGETQQHTGQNGRKALDNALRLGPQDVVVRSLRALYWRRQGNYSAALAEQLQAAALEPQNAALQSALGEAYAAAGDLVSALSAYQKATVLGPEDPATWRQLATFCADNGVQVEQIGLPAALKASALAPHDAQTLDVLGWSYVQAGLPYTAKETLLQAIQAEPELALAHVHLAETYLRLGDYASAPAELQKAVELDPTGPAGLLAQQLLSRYFP